jgi:hypothetical protein
MAKANAHSTTVPAKWANVHFQGYWPGKGPFVFNIMAGDDGGNCIYGTAGMIREVAITTALNILSAAAVLEGLTEEQRAKLRDLAASEPTFTFGDRIAAAG